MSKSKVIGKPSAKIKSIINEVNRIPSFIENLAEECKEIARETLMQYAQEPLTGTSLFTQKHGEELVNYIVAQPITSSGKQSTDKNSKSWEVRAGVNVSEEIALELYYAEYGAGILADTVAISQRPIPKYTPNHTLKSGYWYFKLLEGQTTVKTHGKHIGMETIYGYTNQSIPVRYMAIARKWGRLKMVGKRNTLKTSITRIWNTQYINKG